MGVNSKNKIEDSNTLKLVAESMQQKLEHEIIFYPTTYIPDNDKRQGEEIPQGTVIMLESLHKNPNECGSAFVDGKNLSSTISSQVQYARELGKYGHVYINDCIEDITSKGTSIADIHCEQNVMGLRLGHEIRTLGEFFMKRTQPCLAIISPASVKDLLLEVYNMVHVTTDIYIAGKSAIQLFGILKLVNPNRLNIAEPIECKEILKHLAIIIKRAKKYRCRLHFPDSYIMGKLIRSVIVEEKKEPPTEEGKEEKITKLFKSNWVIDANEQKPIALSVHTMEELLDYIGKIKECATNPVTKEYKEDENAREDIIVDYGVPTYQYLKDLISKSLRVFVKGDLMTIAESSNIQLPGLWPLQCHRINLDVLEYMRQAKEKQYEKKRLKPVIMICGKPTELSFVSSYKAQKDYEKLKKEEERKKMKEQNEDFEEEPQDNMEGDGGKEALNLMIHCDLLCIEKGWILDKVLQNQYIRGLDRFDVKPEPTRDQLEEDLSILDEI
jgi:3-phosphoglycerate kinase